MNEKYYCGLKHYILQFVMSINLVGFIIDSDLFAKIVDCIVSLTIIDCISIIFPVC